MGNGSAVRLFHRSRAAITLTAEGCLIPRALPAADLFHETKRADLELFEDPQRAPGRAAYCVSPAIGRHADDAYSRSGVHAGPPIRLILDLDFSDLVRIRDSGGLATP